MESQIEKAILDIKEMLSKGQFVEAMEKYLDDEVSLQEGNDTPKKGKAYCIQVEKEALATVTDFGGYEIKHYAINGNTSYYEAIMEYTTNDGVSHRFEQVVRTVWKGGKIIDERYYHV